MQQNYDRLPNTDCRICRTKKLSNRITIGLLMDGRVLLVGSAGVQYVIIANFRHSGPADFWCYFIPVKAKGSELAGVSP